MRLFGALACGIAAYLLADSPLGTATWVAAGVNVLALVAGAAVATSPGLSRASTAVGHLTTGLVAFFLFVWLAAR